MRTFELDTLCRLTVEVARYWLLTHYQNHHNLPKERSVFVYSEGASHSMDWGNPPGPDDSELQPMRGKRIRVTFIVEDV